MRKTIFRCRVGSHLYGLNTPESDEDFFEVFIPSTEDILGLHPVKEINNSTKSSSEDRRNTKDDKDDIAKALPEFIKLVAGNNPNIVEVLFATPENIITLEPEFKELMDNYDKIISKKVLHTFSGYAFSQRKKLTVKKERYGYLSDALSYMKSYFSHYELTSGKRKFDEAEAKFLNDLLGHRKGMKGNVQSFQKGHNVCDAFRLIKEEYENYGWRVKTESFEKLGYDVKFAYHLIRILSEGTTLLHKGKLSYPIDGKAKEDIMKIRNQEVSYEDLLELYKTYDEECQVASRNTKLRHHADMKWLEEYQVRILKTHIINS